MRKKDPKLMQKLVDSIEDYYASNMRMPSVYDLAAMTGSSKSNVHRYLVEMNEKGMIRYDSGEIMTDKIESQYHGVRSCPIVGSIPCGPPEAEEENVEGYIPLPTSLIGNRKAYVLRADGDSMTGAGIDEGDLVVIRWQETAETGNIVAALVDGNESTLKRLQWDPEKQTHYLHPENPRLSDMYFDTIIIQGVAVSVIKKL